MAWTSPRTWVAGETVNAALFNTHLRDNMKAIGDPWTSYSPTYGGFTLGNGTATTKYLQAGKLVVGEVEIVFGSTSAYTAGFTVSLPVTAAVINLPVGAILLSDTSAGANRTGAALVQTGGTAVAFIDGAGALVSNASPWAWATGDTLAFSFTYEAA